MNPPVYLLIAALLTGCAASGPPIDSVNESRRSIYVEDIARARDTQFFRIAEKVRCDEFDRTIFVHNPPDWTIGWARRERLVPQLVVDRCISALRAKYAEKDQFPGVDGVLVDGQTWELVGDTRIGADAWTVKFTEPTQDDIRQRLRTPARKPIDLLQLKTILRWIESHKAETFLDDLKAALPINLAEHPTRGWGEGETEVLRTFARLGITQDELWLSILRAGIEPGLDQNHSFSPARGAHATIAGQRIGCSGRKELVPELERILRGITIAPHKIAAAKALVTLGDRGSVKSVAIGMRPSPVQQQLKNMADANLPYTCKEKI